jgi:polysaccharide biosynthesis protein PslH
MRVVLVSSFPAFPTTAGNRSRIRQLALSIKELGHDLTFVYLESRWEACDDAAHRSAFGAGKFIRLEKKHWLGKWACGAAIGAAKRVLRLAGLEAAYYSTLDRFRDRNFFAALQRLGLRPDTVLVEYVLDSWAFDAFPEAARRVLDTHDVFADRHRDYVARGIQDYWVSLSPKAEDEGLRRAHVVLAIQQDEAQRFRHRLGQERRGVNPRVAVVSHLLEFGACEVDYAVGNSAVFLASDNAANRHAINAFIANTLPHVRREIPGFELKLAGSICGSVPDAPNLTKLGWVDDVSRVFAHTPLSINPMLAGTGINIKLLDAMASAVPTVSTATGARGVPEPLRKGLFVVPDHDAEAFAAAVVRLANDTALRREKGRAAREDAKRWHGEQLAELDRCLAGA